MRPNGRAACRAGRCCHLMAQFAVKQLTRPGVRITKGGTAMSTGLSVGGIHPAGKSWLRREARDVVSMEELVRRLTHASERRPTSPQTVGSLRAQLGE